MTHAESLAQKKALRETVVARRRALSDSFRHKASAAICARFYEEKAFCAAQTVFAYASMPDEIQLYELLAVCLVCGKRVALPLITGKGEMEAVALPALDALVTGAFGIQTVDPARQRIVPAGEIDCIVVPGAAFTERGDRLGLGGGYYDRYMAEKAPQASRVALTFDCLVVPSIPMEAHDQRVETILTETRRIAVTSKKHLRKGSEAVAKR